ncbi:DUF1564 family protein [Leptospira idonii]|uniref:DUF1564 family protein n=1 Tax=Leptospira idonii TaxID=1193500 RepID=A0A4V3JY41_9LEPT|nr:DUF1564 family protein [Leptospira idonii]TGN19846.1 DUF1564 family protein [Leptospira idonii]
MGRSQFQRFQNPAYSNSIRTKRSRVASFNYRKHAVMFLVPQDLLPHLRSLLAKRPFHSVVRGLLAKYFEMILSDASWGRSKIGRRYQEQNLDLKRIGTRIQEKDLIELDLLAEYLGVSRCFLFARLLELDLIGWGPVLREVGFVRSICASIVFT